MFILCMLLYAVKAKELSFGAEPEAIQAIIGEKVRLQCNVDGNEKEDRYMVQWLKGGLGLGFPPLLKSRYSAAIGASDYSLSIDNVQLSDEGQFECQITPAGLRSKTAKLSVLVPPKTVDISPVGGDFETVKTGNIELIKVVEGKPTKVRCIATDSKPQTNLQWTLGDEKMDSTASVSGDLLLTTFSEVTIVPTKNDNGKQLSCLAENPALGATPTRVLVQLDVQTLPEVTVVLPDEPVEEGSSLTVSCKSESNPPASSFSWSLDGVVLDSDDSSSLTIQNVDWSFHTRRIECTATNAIGSGSTAASIAVLFAPVVVGEPVRRTVADEAGLSISVECPILGNPEPRYIWIKDDNTVHTTTSKTHSIERINQNHAGNYRCIATSDLGSAEATVELAIKGPPSILSTKEQFGMELECAFISEPKPSHVRIVDLGKSEDEGIIHELFGDAVKNVKINAGVGQFECLVENELGTSTTIIRLQPEGITAQAKFGIVFGILGFGLIFCLALCVKLRWFPAEQQLKINNSDFNDCNSRSERQFNYDPVRGYNPSLSSSQIKHTHLKAVHSSADEVFLADEIQSSRNVRLGNSLGINADTASTERSHHDDGYGTESGSNQKVNTMSDASESNSDYEVHVASLSSAAGAVPNSDKSSKICVIWDDASSSYNPNQIRAHTAALQNKINRARSVSHV